MAADIAELLNHENIEKVDAVGHDFGSLFLSQLINYHPTRFHSSTFSAVPYAPPGMRFDLYLSKNEGSKDSVKADSFYSLMYGSEEDTTKRFYALGALPASLKENHIAPPPTWQIPLHVSNRSQIFSDSSFRGPRNWYRCRYGQGLGIEKEKEDKLDPRIPCRALFIEQYHKSVVRMESVSKHMELFAKDFLLQRWVLQAIGCTLKRRVRLMSFWKSFSRGN
ncbi:hypothetical protein BPOR_0106g00060 [Botrytis porri]|uniref:AB hydrolase-1 domain-containing protein n=1 Tax=Botrytis porri TaxID=87229 RepID=A0A4Z1KY71_9HELO|nr:hypothetical protein BPOR_0106g00060 [Botrytis porri]